MTGHGLALNSECFDLGHELRIPEKVNKVTASETRSSSEGLRSVEQN